MCKVSLCNKIQLLSTQWTDDTVGHMIVDISTATTKRLQNYQMASSLVQVNTRDTCMSCVVVRDLAVDRLSK